MIRAAISAALLLALASATPLWLRPEAPLDSHLSTNPRDLAEYLLPTDLVPSQYDVHLIPFLNEDVPDGKEAFTFDGKVIIRVKCATATSKIQMHAFNMTLSEVKVMTVEATPADLVVKSNTDPTTDDKNFIFIEMDQPLVKDAEYDIVITFVGILNDQLDGFYRSSYVEGGVTKYMAVTQFESTGARRAFPSFDEPDLKAMFRIKIGRASDAYTVLGNMEVTKFDEDVEGLPGWKWVEFENTVAMSTYLVAFSVNKFAELDGGKVEDVSYKVWARPNAVNTGKYANDMAPKVVKHMEDFTGHQYALKKIDQIAVPDFAAGAMENWGLITYRETALLYDETKASTSNKQRVGAVVTHELAHQWFGNLVSPKWWSNLWLNEGFATYFEYHASNAIEDNWKMDEQFIYEQLHTVLESDALESTHPIVANVDSPSTIDSIFDDISYNKGGCMVRFMVNLLGEDKFKTGINTYLETNKFNNAAADDLWTALQTVVEEGLLPGRLTFKDLMDTWTTQPGYPVVKVERFYDDGMRAIVSQERFLNIPKENLTEQWIVPLTMTNGAEKNFTDLSPDAWLTLDAPGIVLDKVAANDDWIILNLQQLGFYRVNYDEENWRLLAMAINSSETLDNLHVINRAQIMNDALALARAKFVSYPVALDTTNYLNFETEYLPWASAFSSLEYVNDRLSSEEESRKLFEVYLLARLMDTYVRLGGFTIPEGGEEHTISLTRSLVLKWACELGHEGCNNDASLKFKEWKETPKPEANNPVHPNVKNVVYCSGLKLGGEEEWNFLFDQYKQAFETATEQSLILSALGCSTNTSILENYLSMSITGDSEIRTQDSRSVLTSVYSNPIGVDIALDFLINHFEILRENMGGFSSVGRVFSGIATKLNTVDQRAKLQAFYDEEESNLGGAAPSVLGALKTVDENIMWYNDHKQTVVDYLKAKSSATLAILSPLLVLVATLINRLFN